MGWLTSSLRRREFSSFARQSLSAVVARQLFDLAPRAAPSFLVNLDKAPTASSWSMIDPLAAMVMTPTETLTSVLPLIADDRRFSPAADLYGPSTVLNATAGLKVAPARPWFLLRWRLNRHRMLLPVFVARLVVRLSLRGVKSGGAHAKPRRKPSSEIICY